MQYHFEGLEVWQRSLELVKRVYQITQSFPKEEIYGLTGQMHRASVSIPANIAEGKGRRHQKEYIQFLYTARGSVFELTALIRVSQELKYLTPPQAEGLLQLSSEIAAMLSGLIKSLQ